MNKFAPITSSLLARKGEAGPSVATAAKLPFYWANAVPPAEMREGEQHAVEARANEAAPAQKLVEFKLRSAEPARGARDSGTTSRGPSEPHSLGQTGGTTPPGQKPRRISIALFAAEYETLGIIAVKRGLTRHQVVRDALDSYFETLAREYRTQCSCIATGCSCAGECAAD